MKKADIDHAVTTLRTGGLVAFPTETVYGLAADASNSDAISRLFRVKGRPRSKPFALMLPSGVKPTDWAEWSQDAERLAAAFWPGPLTIIAPQLPSVDPLITAGSGGVGFRVPAHDGVLALLNAFNGALVVTSANSSGCEDHTATAGVLDDLGDRIDFIISGSCQSGVPSTVVSLLGPATVIREGGISKQRIRDILPGATP